VDAARITNNRREGTVSMKDSQILSTFQDAPAMLPAHPHARALVFDACHIGVILRAVLFVETVVAVGAMYGAVNLFDWLLRVSVLSGAALPATLAWLIVACSLKQLLARLSPTAQQIFGLALGALAGLYGCAMMALIGVAGSVPWVASALTGALLSSVLVFALVLRAKGRMPADTEARLSEL
jgi:two-component system, LytTR family, sensor histidine kinase AlgZ